MKSITKLITLLVTLILLISVFPSLAQNRSPDILGPNEVLQSNQSIKSADGRFTLIMQDDCNLVLYPNGVDATWASNTAGAAPGPCYAVMQSDGNLVIYDVNGYAVWATNTVGVTSKLVIQNDGNLVIYKECCILDPGAATWASNTGDYVEQIAPPSTHISITVQRLQAFSADSCNQSMDFYGGLFLYWDADNDAEAEENFGVHQGNDIAPNWELGGDIAGTVTEFAAAIVVKDEDDKICGGGDDNVDLNPYSDDTHVMVKVSVPAGEVWLVTERSTIFLGFVGQSLEVGPGTNAREWGKVTFRVDVS